MSNNLLPTKTKIEVLKEHFGDMYYEMKKYEQFQRCNENQFLRDNIKNDICPICGQKIKETDEKALHHLDYDRQCCYKGHLRCEQCQRNHISEFEECKKKLVYMHKKCHASIHGKEC